MSNARLVLSAKFVHFEPQILAAGSFTAYEIRDVTSSTIANGNVQWRSCLFIAKVVHFECKIQAAGSSTACASMIADVVVGLSRILEGIAYTYTVE